MQQHRSHVGGITAVGLAMAVSISLSVLAGCLGEVESGPGAGGPAGSGGGSGAATGSGGTGAGSGTGGGGATTGTGGSGIPPSTSWMNAALPSTTQFARLSHKQWENTINDLLKLTTPAAIGPTLLSETVRGTFDNDGGYLNVSPGLWIDYQRAAETLAEATVKDPRRLTAILPAGLPTDPAGRARAFIQGFGLRAYRRPLTEPEITQYLGLFNQGPMLVGSADAFADGVRLVLTLMLQSPHFAYRTELGTGAAVNGKMPLTDYEVASKLSYGLVGSMPDDALFTASAARQLTTKVGVVTQATRLLATTNARRTIDDFHSQLLHFSKYDQISKDNSKFPIYNSNMPGHMKTETQTFLRDALLTRDKGLTELLLAPYTFVNSVLAPLYGLTSPARPATGQPDNFVRVDLDPTKRAGLLTQVGFLSAFADGREPSTILRGAFINIDLLCVDLPPPPDAFTLPAPSAGKTNRQRVDATTNTGVCSACHVKLINPPGFALESFDALGQYRTTDNNLPVDTTGTYTFDGVDKPFKNGLELAKLIAESRQAHDCYSQHWIEYVLGRDVDKTKDPDRGMIATFGDKSLKTAASLKSLLLDAVASDSFLMRAPTGVSP